MTIPSASADARGRGQRADLPSSRRQGPRAQAGARPEPVLRERRAIGDVVTDRHGEQWVELPKPILGRRCLTREHLSSSMPPYWGPWREAEVPIAASAMLVEVK